MGGDGRQRIAEHERVPTDSTPFRVLRLNDMEPFDWAQLFVERCERPDSKPALMAIFERALERMGFRYYACCSHVDFKHPPQSAVVLHNYPLDWADEYTERNLFRFDPVRQHAERSLLPFRWNSSGFTAGLTKSQRLILREAASAGIVNGYTVPIHVPWTAGALRASCSVIPDSNAIDERAYRAVQIMAIYLYASMEHREGVNATPESGLKSAPVLSERERQCLEMAAQGKSDWDISQLLGISESTVHKHVESAKRRLGVSTRIQAIVWAVRNSEICFGDVMPPTFVGRTRRSATH
jgi:DNA-binding CsgD family transcriptional regulator